MRQSAFVTSYYMRRSFAPLLLPTAMRSESFRATPYSLLRREASPLGLLATPYSLLTTYPTTPNAPAAAEAIALTVAVRNNHQDAAAAALRVSSTCCAACCLAASRRIAVSV